MPDLVGNEARMSTPANYARMAKRDNLTLRQVAIRSAAGKDHWTLIGSPIQIVDQFEDWSSTKARMASTCCRPLCPAP